MAINPSDTTPLYQQIAADIREKIASGELAVGARLEPNRDLVNRYDVSVVTVNKALTLLVSEGLIYTRVGRGTFVAQMPQTAHAAFSGGGTDAGLLGFVLRDLSSPYFSLIAYAAQERADAAGYGLVFASSSRGLDNEEQQIRRLRRLGVDGLIIASMRRLYRTNEPIQELQREGVPFVMVSFTEGDDVPFIGTDLERTGYLAARHLLSTGRKRIGYVSDQRGSSPGELRKRGYRRALAEHGQPVRPEFEFEYPLVGESQDYWSGYAIGERVAALPQRPDAMFVFNDLGAIGFEDALLDRGIRVPEEIAVVGVDDIEESARARVPLTTVRQPTAKIGALAVDSLIARLRGEAVPVRQLFDPELVIRESCGTAQRTALPAAPLP
ncbi:MAG TPA: GntR family transcriptional regulator [Longimicrobiaceae bacterium]|nr:GntR family transcriptional regulator [Longimicrobiaceae bacterium]